MKKILIIEDDEEIIETLSELLRLENYEVFSAKGGKEGIKTALKVIPDLIICDIMMPGIDGYEVLQTIKHNPSTFSIPFLFLTAKTENKDLRLGMELGADDYITKPYQDEDILNAIEARLKKKSELSGYYEKKLDDMHTYIAASLPGQLRPPLNTIIGFTRILKNKYKDLSDEEMEKMLDNIYSAGTRLLEMIVNYTYYTTLIDLSSSGTKYPDEITKYTQTIIYNEVIETAKKYDRINDLILELTDTPLKVADSHLAKITRELTDNAFRYSPPDTEVQISSKLDNGQYTLIFKNAGKGLTEQQIKKISPFIQYNIKEYEKKGSGLGLAIVRKIVNIYEGEFKIESEPFNETKVKVTLPVYKD